MRTDKTESEYQEIKQALSEIKKNVEETKKATQKVRNYMRWMQITSVFRLIVIIIPIILALIYVPPLVDKLGGLYKGFFGGSEQGNLIQEFLKIKNLNTK